MDGYKIASLADMIEAIGEEKVKSILADFSCPLNPEVEKFIRGTAAVFEKQGISKTKLIFAQYKGAPVLVGYFTLSNKFLQIPAKGLSSSWKKRIGKFAVKNNEVECYQIAAPLIAQLGKNFQNEYNTLISGNELLKMAVDSISEAQRIIGGKIAYLECEDIEKLKSFYRTNGFYEFGKRALEKSETDLKGEYLIQMLSYINT